VRLRGAALGVLVDELRALPDGLATRVRADLLVAEVLRALRWHEVAIAAALDGGAAAQTSPEDWLRILAVRLAGRTLGSPGGVRGSPVPV